MQQCLEALEGRCLGMCQQQESKQGLTVLVFTVVAAPEGRLSHARQSPIASCKAA